MTEQTPWLLIDVGNTAIKWRLANAEGLLDAGGSISDMSSLCKAIEPENWGVAGLASVASDAADAELIAALTASRATVVHRATAQSTCLGLVSSYVEPESMGVDRWLAMLAAHAHNEGALCVIDAGTAVTVDLVSAEGVHEGGYVLPGADLMRRALSNETDRIHVNALESPAIVPGNNTQACVTAGSWRAVMGAVESTMAEYPGHRPLLTGGSAITLRDFGLVATHNPDLVMEGLKLWLSQTLDDQSP
jgi:type III pantothenate kinase